MKKKEKTNIAGNTIEELKTLLTETSDKLVKLGLNRATSQSHNTRESRALRLKKAVIMTTIREKEMHHG